MSENEYSASVGDTVLSIDGANVGTVTNIIERDGKPAFVQVVDETGFLGLGTKHYLVPLTAIKSHTPGQIEVDRSSEDLVGLPAHDEAEEPKPDYWTSLFAWWARANEN